MKKFFLLATVACLTMASCEDVPAPYELFDPSNPTGGQGGTESVLPAGEGTAESPYNVAAISQIDPGTGVTSTETYYVTGKISQLKEFGDSYGNYSYYISDDGTTTNQYYIYRGYGLNGDKFTSAEQLNVGDSVVIAGKIVNYNGTLEFAQGNKLVYINGQGSEPTPTPDELGENLLTEGGFENWTDGVPAGWKSASTASNATVSASEDAHGGKYAVLVVGSADQNKRLASVELNLKPGTYYATFYAKSAGECTSTYGRQCRPGYVPVTNGSVGEYTYSEYASLTEKDWTKCEYSFKLNSASTVCLVVMAPKACGDLLVDDFELRTSDGGLGEGGSDNPGVDPTPGDVQQITIAEFLEKRDTNTTYRLSGKIANVVAGKEQYGNFDLVDETGTIYIYGLVDASGAYTFQAHGLKEGDELVVEGKYAEYNGKAEINKALYISHNGNGEGGSVNPGDNPGTDPNPGTNPDAGDYVTFDMSANFFGIDSEKQTAAKTYTNGAYSITLTPAGEGNGFYYNTKDKYVILGKQGATLEFGAFDFAVEKIEVTGRDAASGATLQNIYVGETAVSTQTTGVKGTNTYVIAEGSRAAGTKYVLKVESAHNTQFTSIKIYKAQ